MAVSNVLPKIEYTADGVLTAYTYPFRILASEDLKVFFDDVEQGSGFTVNGIDDENGGTVTFTTAPANNTTVTLQRFVNKDRSVDYVNGSKMDADTFDYDIDRAVMMIQDDSQVLADKIVFAVEQREAAEAAQVAAELAETNAENAAESAALSSNSSLTYSANAANSAVQAATSAANALASENSAYDYMVIADAKAIEASNSASLALNSQNHAFTSETNAAIHQANASTSALSAANSATIASTSAAQAASSAAQAANNLTSVQGVVSTIEATKITLDTFTGDGATVAFTLSDTATAERLFVSINGVAQHPIDAYTVSGTTLTFTEAPSNGSKIQARVLVAAVDLIDSHTHTGFADAVHTHSEYSPTNHTHTEYALVSHAHSGYALDSHAHSNYARLDATSVPTVDNTYDLGSVTRNFATIYATTFNGTSTTAQYADLAEKYEADAEYPAGVVVGFGGDKEITANIEDGDTRVAGVISTAPAYLMNSKAAGTITLPVALTGRVPCRVTGEVKKGDLLVAAGNGAARAESNPKVGQVIGKALADFNGLKGTIEVVVGRF